MKENITREELAAKLGRLEAQNAELLAALEAWIKVESEMGYNHSCPGLSLRARYRDEAKRLTRAAIASARKGAA